MNQTLKYITKLTSIASPTGYTNEIINYLKEEISSLGYQPIITNKGSLMVNVKGKNDEK